MNGRMEAKRDLLELMFQLKAVDRRGMTSGQAKKTRVIEDGK